MENSIAVANYLIAKSISEGIELTPMKLVKLTYIAHGWYLALNNGEALLPEAVEAWKYGPVVPSVYHSFKEYEGSQVTSLKCIGNTIPVVQDETNKQFLDKVWDVYKKYNGFQLSTLTHEPNTPWDIVWNQQNGKKQKHVIIPNNIIQAHYRSKMPEHQAA